MKTDNTGWFRVEALFPGYKFVCQTARASCGFGDGLRAGQTKNLGDVKIKGGEK